MEVYYYRCPVCGFLYQVPSYWMGYSPEETAEQMHFSPETHEVCPQQVLNFESEGNTEE